MNTGATCKWFHDLLFYTSLHIIILDRFCMPHGLTIDHEGNVWVTDVALHQVMKFGAKSDMKIPEITLGTAFKPGSSRTKFCKPTSVAVLPDGQFFVADGYCNSRILKYSKSGELLLSWGQNSFQGQAHDIAPENFFAVPHALTLVPEMNLLCVADRENGRVQCFQTLNGTFHSQYYRYGIIIYWMTVILFYSIAVRS